MRNPILCSACLLIVSNTMAVEATTAAASPAAPATERPACDAHYYSYLVGKGLDEARSVDGTNYRVLSSDSARGPANPKRMTIVYDAKSSQITEVACG